MWRFLAVQRDLERKSIAAISNNHIHIVTNLLCYRKKVGNCNNDSSPHIGIWKYKTTNLTFCIFNELLSRDCCKITLVPKSYCKRESTFLLNVFWYEFVSFVMFSIMCHLCLLTMHCFVKKRLLSCQLSRENISDAISFWTIFQPFRRFRCLIFLDDPTLSSLALEFSPYFVRLLSLFYTCTKNMHS